MRVQRFGREIYGQDSSGETWVKIPASFRARYIAIGPSSEWDSALVKDTDLGDVVVSVGAPLIFAPPSRDIIIAPYRTRGMVDLGGATYPTPGATSHLLATLDIVAADEEPRAFPLRRPPLIRQQTRLGASSGLTTSLERVATWCTAGRDALTVHLRNRDTTNTQSFYFVGNKFGSTSPGSVAGAAYDFPITNAGTSAAPLTIAALTSAAYSLDVSSDRFDWISLYAATSSGTSTGLYYWSELADA